MYKATILFLVATAFCVAYGHDEEEKQPKCPNNEIFIECGQPCPEASCKQPNPPPCLILSCRIGCFCNPGFYRDSNNKCVSKEQCKKDCGEHAHYDDCPPVNCPPGRACAQVCRGRCVCDDGYKFNAGECIKEVKCKGNSYPSNCPDPCPATCSHTKPLPCKRMCSPGCQCKDGYVLDKIGGECVKIECCKDLNICSKNETWTSCNPNCPDQYCPSDDQPQPVCDAPTDCPGGCRCKINYRRHPSGECKLASECPPVECTRQNEVWNPCPEECNSEFCEAAYDPPVTCNTLLLNCQPKCTCRKDHFRNDEGLCIPREDCPPNKKCSTVVPT